MRELRLILGVGRSGTTWLSYVLGQTPTPIRFFMEGLLPAMTRTGSLLEGYRSFLANDYPSELEGYLERDDPAWRYCLVKEVHGLLATEAVLRQLPCKAALLIRDPVRVVDSLITRDGLRGDYLRDEMKQICGDAPGDGRKAAIGRLVTTVATVNATFHALARTHDNAYLVEYEHLCQDPLGGFVTVANSLDLKWGEENRRLLNDTTTGHHRQGIRFSIFRDTDRQLARPWTALTDAEVERGYRLLEEIEA